MANVIFLINTISNMQILQGLKKRPTVCYYLLVWHELLIGSLMLDGFGESFWYVFHDEVKICALGVIICTFGSSMKKNLCNLTIF